MAQLTPASPPASLLAALRPDLLRYADDVASRFGLTPTQAACVRAASGRPFHGPLRDAHEAPSDQCRRDHGAQGSLRHDGLDVDPQETENRLGEPDGLHLLHEHRRTTGRHGGVAATHDRAKLREVTGGRFG